MESTNMNTVNLPNTTEVVVNKTGRSYTIDWSRVPESSVQFFIEYGLEQKFNDSHSSITRGGKNPFQGTDAAFEAAVHEITDDIESRMYAGTLGVRTRRVEDTAKKLARLAQTDPEQLAQLLRAAGIEVAKPKKSAA